MPRYVIDTNVAIVANGGDESVRISCRTSAIELLVKAVNSGTICVDSGGEIQAEYRHHLNPKGQPGVGDRFYLEVLNSHPKRVQRVDIEKLPSGEYKDLPQAVVDSGFDPSDRKFAAVARKASAPVYNAIDSDWVEKREVIEASGIIIKFVCGCNPNEWR